MRVSVNHSTAEEFESLWKVLPNLPDEYGRLAPPYNAYAPQMS